MNFPVKDSVFRTGQETENYYSDWMYKVRLGMSSDVYFQTLDRLHEQGEISENTRTIMHEYGHWLQFQATPFGMYLDRLLEHSTWILLSLIKTMIRVWGKEHTVTLPVLSMWEQTPELFNDTTVSGLLYEWLDLQAVLNYLKSSPWDYSKDNADYNAIRNDAMRMFVSPYIARVDKILATHFSRAPGANFQYRPPLDYLYRGVKGERVRAMRYEMAILETRIGLGLSATSLFESFSTALEWCLSPDEFQMPKKISPELSDYYFLISLLASRLTAYHCSKNQLLATCVAVFDIVFSPPSLPQCCRLRSQTFSLCDFDVNSRFIQLMWQLSRYGPIRNSQTMEEYEGGLCNALGWASPDAVAAELVKHFTPLPEEPTTNLFLWFQENRCRGFWPFFDREFFLAGHNMPIPPVVECNDRLLIAHFHNFHEYNNEVNFVMTYLLRKFAIQAMTSNEILIEFPYPIRESRLAFYREILRDTLRKIGIQIHMDDLRLRSPTPPKGWNPTSNSYL